MLDALLKHDGWRIGVIRAPIATLLEASERTPIEWLPVARPHSFVADPFGIEHAGVPYCFFEELPYRSNRGKIAFCRLDGADGYTIHDAIVRPYHLSYPFLLRYGDEVLCIPEAAQSGCVTAYAARAFPYGWYERAVLLRFPGVDPTIFRHGDRWWLFCTDGAHGWNADLYAWYADDPLGPWQPHAANPIKRDLAGARPAGTPFVAGGRLFRPAQDCSHHYGARVIFHEILELEPGAFREAPAAVLEPDRVQPDGLHTASACNGFTIVDGNRLAFEPWQALRTVAGWTAKRVLRTGR